jgi:hypothetical protein
MLKSVDCSFLMRLTQTLTLALALMTGSAVRVRAETVTVQGADGAGPVSEAVGIGLA